MMADKVKLGAVGLGRLGYVHAHNAATKVVNAELVAVCDIDPVVLKKFMEEHPGVRGYDNYQKMIAQEQLDGILIVPPSALHPEMIEYSLDQGLNVFSEKPIGTTMQECERVEHAVNKHPELVFLSGFMRRMDKSYAYAKKLVDEGYIGDPILFKGTTRDCICFLDGAIAYAPHSGGHYLDMVVHDIDLARWFLGSEPEVGWAIGDCYVSDVFAKYDDGDNVTALMKFKNKAMAFFFAGRSAPHGYEVDAEVVGTKATLRIASVPQKNLVEIIDSNGVVKPCSRDFPERFAEAYLAEVQEFVNCVREGRKPELTIHDAICAAKIATTLTEGYKTGELVHFD